MTCIASFPLQASQNRSDQSDLHEILSSSNKSLAIKKEEILKALHNGANVNEIIHGESPLIAAVSPTRGVSFLSNIVTQKDDHNKKISLVEILLSHGADINYQDKEGNTALIKCIENLTSENCNNVAMLIQNNADINLINNKGNNALMELLHCNYNNDADNNATKDITRLLLRKGIPLNVQNKYGNTALHIAIENEQHDIAKLLVQHGASCSITNNNGIAPETVPPFKSSVNNLSYEGAFTCINEIDSVETSKEVKNLLIPFKAIIRRELESYDRLTNLKRELKNTREDVYNDWVRFMIFKRGTHDKAHENGICFLPDLVIEKIFEYTCPTLPNTRAFWKQEKSEVESKKRASSHSLELKEDSERLSKKLKCEENIDDEKNHLN